MKRVSIQLKLATRHPAPAGILTDTGSKTIESYGWRPTTTGPRKRRLFEFWRQDVYVLELTLAEVRSIESRVQKELYP